MLTVIGSIALISFFFAPLGRMLLGGALVLLSQSFVGMLVILIIIKMIGK